MATPVGGAWRSRPWFRSGREPPRIKTTGLCMKSERAFHPMAAVVVRGSDGSDLKTVAGEQLVRAAAAAGQVVRMEAAACSWVFLMVTATRATRSPAPPRKRYKRLWTAISPEDR